MIKIDKDIEFIDQEEQTFGEKTFTYKEIIMRQLERIAVISCKEFRKGYWNEKPIAKDSNVTSKVWIEDTRLAYINAVDMLYDLLIPKFDNEMEKQSKEIAGKIKKDLKTILDKTKEEKEETNKKDLNEVWLNKRLKTKRELFQELSKLLKRLKYLEGKKYEVST